MKLYTKLARACIRDVARDSVRSAMVKSYFQTKKGRYGYHMAQLAEENKLPKPVAAHMSAVMNQWLDDLKALQDHGQLDRKLGERLERCTKSFTSLVNFPARCLTKVCPWCRGITILQIEALLAALKPRGCTMDTYPVSDTRPRVKRAPGAILTVKNVVQGPELRVLRFYQDQGDRSRPNVKIVQDLLAFDYAIFLDQDTRTTWMDWTRGMKFFSRQRSDVQYKHR